MRSILIGFVCFSFTTICFASDHRENIKSADPGELSKIAEHRAIMAGIEMIGSRGAVQVSQVADQAQIDFSQMLIKQNDEIIRLLRIIAKDNK